jgi:hypothetical protein
MDFKYISHPIVIQADGSCHFKPVYDSTTGKQLYDDLRFCAAANTLWLQCGACARVARLVTGTPPHSWLLHFQLLAAHSALW